MVLNNEDDCDGDLTFHSLSRRLEALLSDLDKLGLTVTAIRVSEALDELRILLNKEQPVGGSNSND